MSNILHTPELGYSANGLGFNASTRLFISNDHDDICNQVSNAFKNHCLQSSNEKLSAEMHYIQCERLAIGLLEYSDRVIVNPGCLEDFYIFHLPLSGSVNIRYGHRQFISNANQASLISPHEEFKMVWEANSPQLSLKINNADMLSFLSTYLGPAMAQLINFSPKIYFDNIMSNSLLKMVDLYLKILANSSQIINVNYFKKQYESILVGLLLNEKNMLISQQEMGQNKSTPGYLKKIIDFIHAHLTDELTVELLALHAGVSVRTLHVGFQTSLGTSPMKYIKMLRLDAVYQELKMTGSQAVTQTALKWGFTHLGRFSQDFRKRFGCLPSETYKQR